MKSRSNGWLAGSGREDHGGQDRDLRAHGVCAGAGACAQLRAATGRGSAFAQGARGRASPRARTAARPAVIAFELERVEDLIYAERAYSVSSQDGDVILVGGYGKHWCSRCMDAQCVAPGLDIESDPLRARISEEVCAAHLLAPLGHAGHGCGIWSYRDPYLLARGSLALSHVLRRDGVSPCTADAGLQHPAIWATVLMSGRVAEFTRGYRAQHCCIERIWFPMPRPACVKGHRVAFTWREQAAVWHCVDGATPRLDGRWRAFRQALAQRYEIPVLGVPYRRLHEPAARRPDR